MAKAIFETNSIYKKKNQKKKNQYKILQSTVGWIEYFIKWRLLVCGSKAEVTIFRSTMMSLKSPQSYLKFLVEGEPNSWLWE